MNAQEHRLDAGTGETKFSAQGGGDQIGNIARVENRVNVMRTDVVAAMVDVLQ
jgi:hypothetical protein